MIRQQTERDLLRPEQQCEEHDDQRNGFVEDDRPKRREFEPALENRQTEFRSAQPDQTGKHRDACTGEEPFGMAAVRNP